MLNIYLDLMRVIIEKEMISTNLFEEIPFLYALFLKLVHYGR